MNDVRHILSDTREISRLIGNQVWIRLWTNVGRPTRDLVSAQILDLLW